MTGKVFINYRREDTSQAAGRIYDKLAYSFGNELIFIDIDKIPYGSNFEDHIQEHINSSKVVIVLIGQKWITAGHGIWPFVKRRIDSKADWVRREIATALNRGVQLLPILIDGAKMPNVSQLPEEITALCTHNALHLRHEMFSHDIGALIRTVGSIIDIEPTTLDEENNSAIGIISVARCEITDHSTDAGLQSKVTLSLKNNGKRSVVLQQGEFVVIGEATMTNCMHPQYQLMESSWTYDVDIKGDRTFKGKHYLQPNEVETFEINVGRKHGGPDLTVYKADLKLIFDEDNANISLEGLYLRLTGPISIGGSFTAGVTPEVFCQCMLENIRKFNEIGYDLRSNIDLTTQKMIGKYENGESLDEFHA